MPTIEHAGRTIGYEDMGAGPTMLLLPPGASPAAAWRPVMERLADRVHQVAVNFAGYGETEALRADAPRNLEAEADAVAAVAAQVDGPIHLVGHSYGGAVAMRLAVAGALPLATLTLIEPACYHLLRPAGEKLDKLEVFHPSRMVDRILGMGDVVSLVEKAQEAIDEEEVALPKSEPS